MRLPLGTGIVLLLAACGGDGGGPLANVSGTSTTTSRSSSGLWVTGYYPAYATGVMPISAIPFAAMTHVIHFALVPNGDGTLADPDGLQAQASALVGAAHAAGVKALLGVGGDATVGAPAGFQGATTPANPRRVAGPAPWTHTTAGCGPEPGGR